MKMFVVFVLWFVGMRALFKGYVGTYFTAFALALLVALTGCVSQPEQHYLPSRPSAQSWDQERLKLNDHGCPTAIFVAPGGDLVECEPQVTKGQTGVTTFYPGGTEPNVALAAAGGQTKNRGYPTMEAAAIAGLQSIATKPTAVYYEWGGQIAMDKTDGQYYWHEANTSMHGDHVHIDDSEAPDTFTLVGSYHTHPCLPEHEPDFFSPGDLQAGIFAHETIFMGNLCTGEVHEFKPGDKPDAEYNENVHMWMTKGRIIGKFTEPHQLMVIE